VLALTDSARSVIRDLATRPDVPEGGGLRIAPSDAGELELSLVSGPAPGDEVIDAEGGRLFLEPQTAEALTDQTLDAQVSDDGAGFYLRAEAGRDGTTPTP
jgi:Fe-S cluster assembly iron-binding protein IscA